MRNQKKRPTSNSRTHLHLCIKSYSPPTITARTQNKNFDKNMSACSVRWCKNHAKEKYKGSSSCDAVSFHKFPRNSAMRAKWVSIIRKSRGDLYWQPKICNNVCSEHFDDLDMYLTDTGLRRLRKTAVPKKKLFATIHDSPSEAEPDSRDPLSDSIDIKEEKPNLTSVESEISITIEEQPGSEEEPSSSTPEKPRISRKRSPSITIEEQPVIPFPSKKHLCDKLQEQAESISCAPFPSLSDKRDLISKSILDISHYTVEAVLKKKIQTITKLKKKIKILQQNVRRLTKRNENLKSSNSTLKNSNSTLKSYIKKLKAENKKKEADEGKIVFYVLE